MAFLIPSLITAGATLGGAYLNRRKSKETKVQKQKRSLIDQIMASLSGDGPYSDLFTMDEEAFEKSFIEPARSRFKNITAPDIQQQYIHAGLERGTGLDDALIRAGVDMDAQLNQQYGDFLSKAQDRKMNAFNSILGAGEGAEPGQSGGEALQEGAAGYLSSPAFKDSMQTVLDHVRRNRAKAKPGFEDTV